MNEDFCTVGIDGGGSKTECAIVSSRGEVLGVGLGGSCNTNYVTFEEMVESVETACRLADEAAGPNRPRVVRTGGGIFRARRRMQPSRPLPDHIQLIENRILARFGGEVQHVEEGEIALGCIDAFDRVGIACIAGTGSSCFGYGRDHRRALCGGWGSPLGDEGGAFDVAIQALRVAGKAYEGRGPDTLLVGLATEYFGENLDHWFLRKLGPHAQKRRREVAGFAKMVGRAADEGDESARKILELAGEELGGLATCTARALFEKDDAFPVALHGGVLSNDIVADRSRKIILAGFPNAEVRQSFHSPGVGAALVVAHDYRTGRSVSERVVHPANNEQRCG
jgi:N-acetylglucosamine kinase